MQFEVIRLSVARNGSESIGKCQCCSSGENDAIALWKGVLMCPFCLVHDIMEISTGELNGKIKHGWNI